MTSITEHIEPRNPGDVTDPEHRDLMIQPDPAENGGQSHRGQDDDRHEDAPGREERDGGQVPEPEAWEGNKHSNHGQELRAGHVRPPSTDLSPWEDDAEVVMERDGVGDEGHEDLQVDEGRCYDPAFGSIGFLTNVCVASWLGAPVKAFPKQVGGVGTYYAKPYEQECRGPPSILQGIRCW